MGDTPRPDPELEENPPLTTMEDALQKLGGFSRFQILATSIILLSEIPTAMIAISPVFIGTNNVEFLCKYNKTVKMMSAHNPDICHRKCVLANGDEEPIISIVQEWMLICDRAWISDLFTSIQMMGMMTGALGASQLADRFGRKTVFYSMVAIMGSFGLISGLISHMYLYGILRFLTGIGLGGFYVIYFIFLMEFLTPSWRTISGCLTLWSVGIMLLSLFAYLLPSWRHLTWATSWSALAMLVFYPFIPETPRWLLCKRKTDKAAKSLNKIARMNRKPPLDSISIEALQLSVLKEIAEENKDKQTTWEIFKNPELRSKLAVFMFGWYCVSTVYYSLSFNTKNLAGDPFLNVLYMGIVDLPAFPSGIWFNNKFGRRKTYTGYLIFAFIFLTALLIVDQVMGSEGNEHIISILSYCGRFGVAGAWGVVTCFTAESFPTVCRSTALGVCALFANVGGVVAPQLVYLGLVSPSTPYFIFAGLTLIAACSPYFLSETNNKPLENFVS